MGRLEGTWPGPTPPPPPQLHELPPLPTHTCPPGSPSLPSDNLSPTWASSFWLLLLLGEATSGFWTPTGVPLPSSSPVSLGTAAGVCSSQRRVGSSCATNRPQVPAAGLGPHFSLAQRPRSCPWPGSLHWTPQGPGPSPLCPQCLVHPLRPASGPEKWGIWRCTCRPHGQELSTWPHPCAGEAGKLGPSRGRTESQGPEAEMRVSVGSVVREEVGKGRMEGSAGPVTKPVISLRVSWGRGKGRVGRTLSFPVSADSAWTVGWAARRKQSTEGSSSNPGSPPQRVGRWPWRGQGSVSCGTSSEGRGHLAGTLCAGRGWGGSRGARSG